MTWNTDCLVAEGTESSLGHHWEAVGGDSKETAGGHSMDSGGPGLDSHLLCDLT